MHLRNGYSIKRRIKRSVRMSDTIAKSVEKAGTSISKEKLLDLIRKSPLKQFTYSQSLNSKVMTIVVTL